MAFAAQAIPDGFADIGQGEGRDEIGARVLSTLICQAW